MVRLECESLQLAYYSLTIVVLYRCERLDKLLSVDILYEIIYDL